MDLLFIPIAAVVVTCLVVALLVIWKYITPQKPHKHVFSSEKGLRKWDDGSICLRCSCGKWTNAGFGELVGHGRR